MFNDGVSLADIAAVTGNNRNNYYANNISYEVKYRGDPTLDAADIIYMESAVVNNLQVEVEKNKIEFNGSFSGNVDLRRAMRT